MDRIEKDIAVFSLSRSGSTLIENFLDKIFTNPKSEKGGVKRYWKETQTTRELTGKCDSDFLIINIRDFRDMAASAWRIRHAEYKDGKIVNKMSKDLVIAQSKWAAQEIELLNKVVDANPNALIVKYKDHYKNLDVLVEKIENYLGIKIPQELIDDAKAYVDYDSSKKISEELVQEGIPDRDQFDIYDKDNTSIHARHIYTGNPETWKEFVNEEDWDLYQEPMLEGLRRYGYD